MSDKLLIPVDNLNSYVNHHQYRVSLFKVAFHHQTGHLHEEIIDKKVWCNLMEIFTKSYIAFFGSNASVSGERIKYVPNYRAVNCLPIALDLLYQLYVNSQYASHTRILRYYALGVKPIWDDLHDVDSPVRYAVFKEFMDQRVKDVSLGLEMLYDDRLIDPEEITDRDFDMDRLDPRFLFQPALNMPQKYDDIRWANSYDPFIRRIRQK